jgi:hypothetical protein
LLVHPADVVGAHAPAVQVTPATPQSAVVEHDARTHTPEVHAALA